MTDRELIERAAKAAGLNGVWHDEWKCLSLLGSPLVIDGSFIKHTWSPLTDDGDALRLAVKLRIGIAFHFDAIAAMHVESGRSWPVAYEGDNMAATRRAIVRAAAALAERGGE